MADAKPADFDVGDSAAEGRKWRDVLELAVGYGLILMVIWTPKPLQSWCYWAAIAWIVPTTWLSFDSWKALGLRTSGLWQSFWVVGLALVLAAAAILIASRSHTLHAPHGFAMWVKTFLGYVIWSFIQQLLLQAFFLVRLLRLLPSRKAAVLTAAFIFAVAHLPNPILTPMTLIWGLSACFLFLRYGNIFPLGLAHAIFGICIAVTTPPSAIHHMRVGRGYIVYGPLERHQRSHNDQTMSTHAWVIAAAPTRRS